MSSTSVRSDAVRGLVRHPLVAGAVAVLLTTVITSGAGYLFWTVAAGHFTALALGQSTTLIAAMSAIALICGQPLAQTLLVRAPRSTSTRALVLAATLSSAVAALVISGVAAVVLPRTIASLDVLHQRSIAVVFVGACVMQTVGIVLDGVAIAVRRGRAMTARNGGHALGKLAVAAVAALVIGATNGPLVLVGAWAVVGVLANIGAFGYLMAHTSGTAHLRAVWVQVPLLRRGAAAQTLTSLGGSVPPQLLPLLVAASLGAVSAGYFSLTWLLGGMCFMVSPAVCSALLADGATHPEQLKRKVWMAFGLIAALLAVPVTVFVFAGAPLLRLFGPEYALHGRALLALLAASTIPDAVTNVCVSLLRIKEQLVAAAIVNLLIAAVALGGSLILLPEFGIAGAGIAWIAAQCVGWLALFIGPLYNRLFGPVAPTPAPTRRPARSDAAARLTLPTPRPGTSS